MSDAVPRSFRAQAMDPTTPPQTLRVLAANQFGREVAGNPNTPVDLLLKLAGRYFEEFSANPVLPLLLLEDPGLCARIPGSTLRRLLRREQVPEVFLRTLERHADVEVRESARWHVAICGEDLDAGRAVRDSVANVRSAREPLRELFDLGVVPPWLVEPLAGSNDAELRDLVLRSLKGREDAEARAVLELYRRVGAQMPSKEEKVVGPAADLRAEEMERLAEGGVWARQLAARHPQTPPEVLRRLAGESALPIRCAALRHPFVAEEALWTAAGSGRERVRLAVASNPRAPAGVLDRLATDKSAAVRRAVVRHRRAEVGALRQLANDPDAEVRIAVARHRACPEEVLGALAAAPEVKVRRAVAEHPRTPAAMVAQLAGDADEWVRRAVAKRGDLSEDLRVALMCDESISVRHGMMFNKRNPREMFTELRHIGRKPEEVRQVLARWPLRPLRASGRKERPERFRFPLPRRRFKVHGHGMRESNLHSIALDRTTTEEELDHLAEENSHWVLEAVGGNPNTRPETLKRLIHHPARTWRLYYEILSNPKVPRELLEHFARHSSAEARGYVARNKTTPPEVLRQLATDPDESVRNAVAYHPHAPAEALALLAEEPRENIRWSVLRNAATPWPTIERFLPQAEGDVKIREALALNAALPAEWRQRLARDPEITVRLAFAENPKLTIEDYGVLSADPEPTVRNAANALYRWDEALFRAQAGATKEVSLLKQFAANPKTPADVLERLARHPAQEVRLGVACNQQSPPAAITWLAEDPDPGVRQALLRHPQCPPAVIDRLLEAGIRKSPEIYSLLSSPVLTEAHYRRMLAEGDKEVRSAIAHSDHTPVAILREILRNLPAKEWLSISPKQRLPADLLEEIVAGASPQIRHTFAEHFFTPRAVAERIALTGKLDDFMERRTRAMVARRRDAGVEFLTQLLEREIAWHQTHSFWHNYEDDYHVLVELIARQELPIAGFERLLGHKDQRVRRALLAREDLSPEWRQRLLRDALARNLKRSGTARLAVLTHPSVPEDRMRHFAERGSWLERYAVTQNPNAPADCLRQLAADANSVVRRAAEQALAGRSAQ